MPQCPHPAQREHLKNEHRWGEKWICRGAKTSVDEKNGQTSKWQRPELTK
jgi:hypothetical protein